MGAGSKVEGTRYFNDYKPSEPVLKTRETSQGANLACYKCGQKLKESTNDEKQFHHKFGKKISHIGDCPPARS
jgi:hypothetical protein